MTTPTLLEAARALAEARERYQFLLNAQPDDISIAREVGEQRREAWCDIYAAFDALDAAYRREEYGDES